MPRAGNKNALKHGLYSKQLKPKPRDIANITATILRLEDTLEQTSKRMVKAGDKQFVGLAMVIVAASTSLFTGHRTLALITGKYTPLEDALAELQGIPFNAD